MIPPRRLVILPCYSGDIALARVVIETIEKASVLPGELWIGWNDPEPPPADLAGPGRVVRQFGERLGWAGIGIAVGHGLQYALDAGYDFAVKMDTDTAIIKRGWDRELLGFANVPLPTLTGSLQMHATPGLDAPLSLDPWYRQVIPYLASIPQKDAFGARFLFVNGGLYALNRKLLEVLSARFGLIPRDEERVIPEDILLSLKTEAAGGKLNNAQRNGNGVIAEPHNAGRDGIYAVHPVKHLDALRWFCRDVLEGDIRERLAEMEHQLAALAKPTEVSA